MKQFLKLCKKFIKRVKYIEVCALLFGVWIGWEAQTLCYKEYITSVSQQKEGNIRTYDAENTTDRYGTVGSKPSGQ